MSPGAMQIQKHKWKQTVRGLLRAFNLHPVLVVIVISISFVLVSWQFWVWEFIQACSQPEFVHAVFIGLLTFLLGLILARAIRVEELVTHRSAALQAANEHLKKEIEERSKLETELLKRSQELAYNDERFQLVAEQTGQIVYDYWPATGQRIVMGDVQMILGYSREEFNALDDNGLTALIHPDDRPTVTREMRRTLLKPGRFAFAYRKRRKSGTYADILNRGVSLADDQGRVRRVLGILADMSDFQALEEETRRHLRFFKTLLDTIPIPVFYIDKDGRYRHCNPAYAGQVLGLPLNRIVGKTVPELAPAIPPALGRLYQKKNRELLEKGGVQRYEVPVQCADGMLREFLVTKAAFYGKEGDAEGILAVMLDITEHKKAEQAIALSRRQLADAMDLAQLAHWRHDPVQGVFTFNDRFYSLHGTTAGREGGYAMSTDTYVREFLFPEDAHFVNDRISQALQDENNRSTFQIEHRIRRRDGPTAYVLVKIEITRDASGLPTQVVGTTQDITLRRKAEEDLNMLWLAMEQSPAIVVITNAKGRIEYVNQRFVEISGFTVAEARGQTPKLLKSGCHPPEHYRDLWQTVLAGKPWRGEFCNRKKDGTLYWESAWISPLRDRNGTMTHFVAVKEDITLRKKVATELKLAEEALRQQAALLRSMTGTTPYSFYVHDNRRDKILYFNRRFCEIWGLEDLQERLDRGELRHSEIFPRFLEKVADPEAFTKYCEPLRHSDNASTMEATIQLRDGRIVHHSSMQIRDEKDELLGRLCLMEDVTQQKLAAQQLAGSLQQKEILLREVYHRVKNNLQVISSLLNLQSSAITDPRTLRLIRETQDRVRSIALVHEKLYRADDLSQIDFAEYTQQLVTMLARSYRTQGYAVNLQFSLQKVLLNLDTSIPCGLILNELISNALKYAFTALPPRQAPEIKVDLQATGPGLYVLSVADNGSGLPPQIDIHNTTSLGLQVVTMLAEQLSGSITVDRNSGTKFTLAFAEVKDRAAGRVPAPPGPPVPAPLPPHPAAAT